MIEPELEKLLPYVDGKYTLVTLAAKRARELLDGQPPLIKTNSTKPVSIALEEIGAGVITYRRQANGVK